MQDGDLRPDMIPKKEYLINKGSRPIFSVVIDAEEDFNWIEPFPGVEHSVDNMRHISQFQDICSAYRVVPTYLLTYPVLMASDIVRNLRARVRAGECAVGIQLHPWVTPPFRFPGQKETKLVQSSYAGNLPAEVERAKLRSLFQKFVESFDCKPDAYRAGRYGLSEATTEILEELDILIDTSIAPRTDFTAEGGPDYTSFGFKPFVFGNKRQLVEIPLCRDILGWTGRLGPALYNAGLRPPGRRIRINGIAATMRAYERITLSPEGNDLDEMKRIACYLCFSSVKFCVLSFHSSSLLAKGVNPYVTNIAELRRFLDRVSGILHYLTQELQACFVKLSEIPSYLGPEIVS